MPEMDKDFVKKEKPRSYDMNAVASSSGRAVLKCLCLISPWVSVARTQQCGMQTRCDPAVRCAAPVTHSSTS
jgi:hypothetical protein